MDLCLYSWMLRGTVREKEFHYLLYWPVLSPLIISRWSPEIKPLVWFFSCQATQLLKFREAPLVVESLASLEKAVPSPKDEEEPIDGGMNQVISEIYKQSISVANFKDW